MWKSWWPSWAPRPNEPQFLCNVKQHWTMHTHWSQFVPNMSTRHPRTLSSTSSFKRHQSLGAVWQSRWTSWAPVPNKPTVFEDVNQHSTNHSNDFGFIWAGVSNVGGYKRNACCLLQRGGGDSSVVRAPDSWLKGRGFESLLERRENFLLQGRLSVLTLISVSVPPPCYHSST